MGRRLMPCNLSLMEQSEVWEQFDAYLTEEEAEQVTEKMDNYLFYQTEARGRERYCVCTHCHCGRFTEDRRKNPGFWRFQHGSITLCPRCHHPVKLMAMGRLRSFRSLNDTKWKRFTICRPGKDGALLLLSAYVNRFYSHDDLRPTLDVSWKMWTYLMPGKRMQWERIWLPQEDQFCGGRYYWNYRWVEKKSVSEPFNCGMYGDGGDSIFINADILYKTALRYCQLEEWMLPTGDYIGTDCPIRNVVKYLSAYTQYPSMEMAIKLGLERAVTELVVTGKKNHGALKWTATTMQDFLRLNKQDAKAFFHAGGDLQMLAAYHTASRLGLTGNMAEFSSLLSSHALTGLYAQDLIRCAKRAGCSIRTAVNYLSKQPETIHRSLNMWQDYLAMAKELGYDLTRKDVTMPRDLQDRHDAASETLSYHRHIEEAKKNEAFNKRLRKMYEFSYGDLCIVVPKSVEEIVLEGKTLKHCVGGYAARHFGDKVTILFLRHKRRPHVPFCTIEIVPRDKFRDEVLIRQIHGYRNEAMDAKGHRPQPPREKHRWFIDIWKDWVMDGSKRDKKGNPIIDIEKEKTA